MTRRPRATSPPRQCTVTLSAVCSISSTGTSSTMWSATRAASRFGISLVPPTNRVVWAPPSDSANKLRRHAAGLNGEQQMQEGHLGGGHREDPDGADLQQGARDNRKPLRVIPGACGDRVPLGGARRQPGRFDRNVGRQHVETAQHQLQFLQLRCEPGVKLVLAATRQSRPGRRTSRPRRTAGRSRRRVRPPVGTFVRGCRRSTAHRVRSVRPG